MKLKAAQGTVAGKWLTTAGSEKFHLFNLFALSGTGDLKSTAIAQKFMAWMRKWLMAATALALMWCRNPLTNKVESQWSYSVGDFDSACEKQDNGWLAVLHYAALGDIRVH